MIRHDFAPSTHIDSVSLVISNLCKDYIKKQLIVNCDYFFDPDYNLKHE